MHDGGVENLDQDVVQGFDLQRLLFLEKLEVFVGHDDHFFLEQKNADGIDLEQQIDGGGIISGVFDNNERVIIVKIQPAEFIQIQTRMNIVFVEMMRRDKLVDFLCVRLGVKAQYRVFFGAFDNAIIFDVVACQHRVPLRGGGAVRRIWRG